MDISKPGKSAPAATSRPLIVNHSGTIIDPMVSTDPRSAPVPSQDALNGTEGVSAAKPRGAKVLQPLSKEKAEKDNKTDKAEKTGAVKELVLPISESMDEPKAEASDQSEAVDVTETDAPEQPEAVVVDADTGTKEPKTDNSDDSSGDEAPTEDSADTTAPDNSSEDEDEKESGEDSESGTTDADSQNAAVVDAVVDQANVGKKQKEEDKEAVARKELVKKLVDEKKYLLPIKQKNTTRSGRMIAVVVVLLFLMTGGAYAAVDAGYIKPGFDVPYHFLKKEVATSVAAPEATPVANTAAPTQATTPVTTPTVLDYSNKELGVSFSYPSSWGEVTANKQAGSISGSSVTFAFSKQPLLIAGMVSRDYKEQGRDGVCYVTLGILPPSTLSTLSGYVKEGDGTSDTQLDYKSTTRILKKTSDTLIYERFETGSSTGVDACLGLSTVGYVSLKSTAAYTGIQFYWGGDAQSRKPVPVTELAAYKATPDKYLDSSTRKDFVSMVESAKSL